MNENDECLLSILQRGIAQARSLCCDGNSQVAADLLDALDNIPRAIFDGTEPYPGALLEQLDVFDKLHPEHCMTGFRWMFENKYSTFPQPEEE